MPPATEAERRRTRMAQRLARWRWVRRAVIGGVLLLGLTVVLSHAGLLGRGTDDWSRLDRRPVHVIRALNGDTLLVRPPLGEEVPVHLVGVAAPEERAYGSAEARPGARVPRRGEGRAPSPGADADAGREWSVLALVYPADADDLNIDLIREGYAYADAGTRTRMRPQFEQAENEARQRKRGLWRGMADERMPAWRREWLRAREEAGSACAARFATALEVKREHSCSSRQTQATPCALSRGVDCVFDGNRKGSPDYLSSTPTPPSRGRKGGSAPAPFAADAVVAGCGIGLVPARAAHRARPRPRVGGVVDLLHPARRQVRVDLRRAQALVARAAPARCAGRRRCSAGASRSCDAACAG